MALDDLLGPPAPPSYYVLRDGGGEPIAFYHESVHGRRLLPRLVDVPPEVPTDPPGTGWAYDPNPDCTIPEEAEPMSDADYAVYFPTEEPGE